MRSVRFLLVPALVAATAAAGPAHAAKPKPKPICNLVKDTAGDAGPVDNAGGATLADPSLDVLSADVGSDGKTLTAVIRVKKLTETDNAAPTGRQWTITMSSGSATFGMNAYLTPFGASFSSGKGSFVYAKNEIHISLTLTDVAYAKVKKGTLLRNFVVNSSLLVGLPPQAGGGGYPPPFVGSEDRVNAAPTVVYPVGALSCVKVGA